MFLFYMLATYQRSWMESHIWEILNGSDHITLSLIEAAEQIDEGDIWKKLNSNTKTLNLE